MKEFKIPTNLEFLALPGLYMEGMGANKARV